MVKYERPSIGMHMTPSHHTTLLINFCRCFQYEHAEEILDALNKDGSRFAHEAIDTIRKRSPTGVKVTLEHIRKGAHLSLKECLQMEHVLWQTVPVSKLMYHPVLLTEQTFLNSSLPMTLWKESHLISYINKCPNGIPVNWKTLILMKTFV